MEVLNFYKLGKVIPENAIYIGRKNDKFNLEKSMFANPFFLNDNEPRGATLDKYKKWLWKQLLDEKITKSDILALKGKDVVCYCAPKPCHGNVLKSAYEYISEHEKDFEEKLEAYKNRKKKLKEKKENGKGFKPKTKAI